MAVPAYQQQSPVPSVRERQSTVFEVKVAPDTPGKTGPTRFEEGLAQTDPTVPSGFIDGLRVGYYESLRHSPPYESKLAGQADGRTGLGARDVQPSFVTAPEVLQDFVTGASGEAGNAVPFPFPTRDFNVGRAVGFTPLDGLKRGERPNSRYSTKQAPSQGGRIHHSEAEVTD